MNKIECFKINIIELNDDAPMDVLSGKSIYRVQCNKIPFVLEPEVIDADPFLFVHNDRLYMFYESKTLYEPGVIRMVSTVDLKNWTDPVIVLAEPFHLSYPFVFEDDGVVYMIPESGQNHSIRLYQAEDEGLTNFRFVKDLIRRDLKTESKPSIDFCDSSILKKDGIYYLFTSDKLSDTYRLRLFYSETLNGDYIEHPKSPIVCSNKYGRCGGSIIKGSNGLFRVAQDCQNGYGDNIHILTIEELNKESYKEHLLKKDVLPGSGFYARGGHQLNLVNYKGRIILATDAKEYHWYIMGRIYRRLKHFQ